MLDFNSKKEILRRLHTKGQKNFFMYVPCAAAAFFVKAWYAVVCRADMALSDKEGNLLGIKGLGERGKAPKKDDIIYVRKPISGRLISAVLAFSMLLMLVPAADLGLSITVNAVVKNEADMAPRGSYYYDKTEWNGERPEISYVNQIIGNGSAKVIWKVSGACGVDKYEIVLIDEDGLETTITTNGRITSRVFEGLSPQVNYTVEVTPVKNVTLYNKLEPDDDIQPPRLVVDWEPLRDAEPVKGETITFELGKLNVAMSPPDIQKIDYDAANNDVTIKWSIAHQVDDPSRFAEGYVVERSEVNTANSGTKGFSTVFSAPITNPEFRVNEDEGIVEWHDKTAIQGMVYEYRILAYRDVFGESSGNYVAGNAGTITSIGSTKRLTTMPTSPHPVSVASNGKNALTVEWTKGKGNVDGFYVYRSEGDEITQKDADAKGYSSFAEYIIDSKASGTKLVDTQDATSASKYSFTDNDAELVNTEMYWYYVIAYVNTSSTTSDQLYSLPGSSSGMINAKIDPPTGLKATPYDGRVEVSWSSVKNADGYFLHITKLRDSEGNDIPEEEQQTETIDLPTNKYTHTDFDGFDLHNNEIYSYTVEAYIRVKINDDPNDPNRYRLISSPPTGPRNAEVGESISSIEDVTATAKDGAVDVTWTAVPGVTGYEVHYWKEGETGETVVDRSRNSFEHKNLKNGDVYYYYIVPYKTVNGVRDTGTPSVTVSATVGIPLSAPQDITTSTTDGQITVKWSKVTGAQGYVLDYRLKGTDRWTSVDVGGETYVHTGLRNDDVYEYRVHAYKNVTGEVYPGPYSNIVIQVVGVKLGTPQNLTATSKDGQISLKWNAVSGAQGYILYYRKAGSSEWSVMPDIAGTSFNHTRLQNGDVYEYKLVAYKEVNGERLVSPESMTISMTVGDVLDTPKDFTVTTTDGTANLRWSASKGAEGYIVYADSSSVPYPYQFDVSRTSYAHSGLINGDTWTYYVVAYKTVNGVRTYSQPTKSISVQVGVSMNAAVDLTATPGNRQVILKWSAVKGAEGYVVYLYNDYTMEYEPITATSKTTYTHQGLVNGKNYRYMVAAYKTVGGERVYGEYSMPVDAIPMTGNLDDIDRELTIKGTAPYGISHGEYISAAANHGAFDKSVDVYFTASDISTKTVREILNGYADGIGSFIVYPFDISIYQENTRIEMEPNRGYNVTITMPIPDRLIAYRDYITVIHINEDAGTETIDDEWYNTTDRRMEVLPAAVIDIDNVWCIQFNVSSFSPFAIVIYKDHISDVSSGGGVADGMFAGNFNSGLLLFTGLPDILLNNNKLHVVSGGRKRYRIKNIEKIVK